MTRIQARLGRDIGIDGGQYKQSHTMINGLPGDMVKRTHTDRLLYWEIDSDVTPGTVFTVDIGGDRRASLYYVCMVESDLSFLEINATDGCYVKGSFSVLAQGIGDQANKLHKWWDAMIKEQFAHDIIRTDIEKAAAARHYAKELEAGEEEPDLFLFSQIPENQTYAYRDFMQVVHSNFSIVKNWETVTAQFHVDTAAAGPDSEAHLAAVATYFTALAMLPLVETVEWRLGKFTHASDGYRLLQDLLIEAQGKLDTMRENPLPVDIGIATTFLNDCQARALLNFTALLNKIFAEFRTA